MAVDPPPAKTAQIATSSSPTPKPKRYWYGWQNLSLYAGTDALLGVGIVYAALGNIDVSVPLLAIGGAAHLAVGPLVHLFHHGDRAVAQAILGMHLLSPVIGVATARLLINCGADKSPACRRKENASLIVGGASGALAAMAVEIAVFSYEDHRKTWSSPRITVAPIGLSREFSGISVAGFF